VLNFEEAAASPARSRNWIRSVIDRLRFIARDDPEWSGIVEDCILPGPTRKSLHLAVFVEPFLSLLMAGKKTVESRFSQNGCAPFDEVSPGDVVLIKRAGDGIVAIAHVSCVHHLTRQGDWTVIRAQYQQQLCATDDAFWTDISEADYASLIWFDRLTAIQSIECEKRDRRGWVVIKRATDQLPLEFE
jgi:hypothetical protein